MTYSESDELCRTRKETKTSNSRKDDDKTHRITVELEAHRFGEKHRADKGPLRRVESYAEALSAVNLNNKTMCALPVLTTTASACSPDVGVSTPRTLITFVPV